MNQSKLVNGTSETHPEIRSGNRALRRAFLGYALGRVKVKGFSLGGVAGSLIMALIIGQLDVSLPDALKAVCFALFIYSVGFNSGPEFFGGLNRSSFKLVISSVVRMRDRIDRHPGHCAGLRFRQGYSPPGSAPAR